MQLGPIRMEQMIVRNKLKTPPGQEAFFTTGAGWAAVSVGVLHDRSSRLAQMMLTIRITKRNMARRITESGRKIKLTKLF